MGACAGATCHGSSDPWRVGPGQIFAPTAVAVLSLGIDVRVAVCTYLGYVQALAGLIFTE